MEFGIDGQLAFHAFCRQNNRKEKFLVVDIVDQKTRSRMMSNIKGKNTGPELILRKELHALGFRYSLHRPDLPGKPDLVFRKHKAVCFVHGCFWHQHTGCKYATRPGTRQEFWDAKLARNVERDEASIAALEKAGWRIAVVWECSLKGRNRALVIAQLAAWLRNSNSLGKFESDI
jgi:DNA mismatch endonuclease (patch repair protein)